MMTGRPWETQPQAKGHLNSWSPQKLGRQEGPCPGASRGSRALRHLGLSLVMLVSGFRPQELQRVHFCRF